MSSTYPPALMNFSRHLPHGALRPNLVVFDMWLGSLLHLQGGSAEGEGFFSALSSTQTLFCNACIGRSVCCTWNIGVFTDNQIRSGRTGVSDREDVNFAGESGHLVCLFLSRICSLVGNSTGQPPGVRGLTPTLTRQQPLPAPRGTGYPRVRYGYPGGQLRNGRVSGLWGVARVARVSAAAQPIDKL